MALPTPAAANHAAWVDGGAGAPESVDFADVAAGSVLVAVGRDSTADAPAAGAVIYRRAGGSWLTDSVLGLPAGATDARLADVALSGNTAWAVGTYLDAGGTIQPLVLRFAGAAGLAAGEPGSWEQPEEPAPAGEPRAIALSGTAGVVGYRSGHVYPVEDGGNDNFGAVLSPPGDPDPAVNGLAAHTPTSGVSGATIEAYAVTDKPSTGDARIYRVLVNSNPALSTMAPALVDETDPGTANLVGVAAARDGSEAVAIEPGNGVSPRIWGPGDTAGAWNREAEDENKFPSSSRLHDASLTATGGLVEAIAGEIASGGDTAGAVWHRGAGAWVRDEGVAKGLGNKPLNGVAVLGAQDIWAVGDGGAVRHYTPQAHPPPPPAIPDTRITSGPAGATGDSTPTFTFTSEPPAASFECALDAASFQPCSSPAEYGPLAPGQHAFAVRGLNSLGQADPSPASRAFTVVVPASGSSGSGGSGGSGGGVDAGSDPGGGGSISDGGSRPSDGGAGGDDDGGGKPEPSPCSNYPEQLARDVTVATRRGELRFEFKLTRKAEVRGVALRRGQVVGRSKRRTLERGRHKLSVGFKKRPTSARLDVDPPRSCQRPPASERDGLARQATTSLKLEGDGHR